MHAYTVLSIGRNILNDIRITLQIVDGYDNSKNTEATDNNFIMCTNLTIATKYNNHTTQT